MLIYSSLGDEEGMRKLAETSLIDKKYNVAFQCFYSLGMPNNCYEILIETDRIPEAAMFARAYLPSKLNHAIGLWKTKVKDKPYVPTSLSDIPENLKIIDLSIKIESVLSEYYSQDKESSVDFDAARERHFKDITQQVYNDEQIDLLKPLEKNEFNYQQIEHQSIDKDQSNEYSDF